MAGPAPLDGPRRARLRAAMLDQFPTRTALAMLVGSTILLFLLNWRLALVSLATIPAIV